MLEIVALLGSYSVSTSFLLGTGLEFSYSGDCCKTRSGEDKEYRDGLSPRSSNTVDVLKESVCLLPLAIDCSYFRASSSSILAFLELFFAPLTGSYCPSSMSSKEHELASSSIFPVMFAVGPLFSLRSSLKLAIWSSSSDSFCSNLSSSFWMTSN